MQSPGMDFLNSRLMFGMVPGLESTRKLCDALGNPERKFKTIHIVGTNGKGSTSYYLAGILQAHGFKTGLFTSPHLVSLRERIRIDDAPIGDADLERLLLRVQDAAKQV
ncbi:MAG: bifunctional folylpolyglutamate synthase/dihydrofolate synthase, partial [Fibrobacter sp.]|nr:bifunctional folylpolyglutamate synthase/dihydrofolate synthase [Fibrobacter sp.]